MFHFPIFFLFLNSLEFPSLYEFDFQSHSQTQHSFSPQTHISHTKPDHMATLEGFNVNDLNPDANEWNPVYDCAPEEDRCLFLTFSKGYPLSERQIVSFFTRKYGPCIERVYVHYRGGENHPPLFGKVVFVASTLPAIIMEGKQEAKFCIESKTLWCKRYEARKARLGF